MWVPKERERSAELCNGCEDCILSPMWVPKKRKRSAGLCNGCEDCILSPMWVPKKREREISWALAMAGLKSGGRKP
jgi:TPP-dependent indolepyruvate ferredoxin oxidoreductase alpha subunit